MNYLTKNSNKNGNEPQLNNENNTEPNKFNEVTNQKKNQILEQNNIITELKK